MSTNEKFRIGLGVALGVAALTLAGFGLAVVYGFNVEYGGGAFAQLGPVVVGLPTIVAVLAVLAWPDPSSRLKVGFPLAVAVTVALAGLGAEALGRDGHQDRLVSESRTFACNGPNAEIQVDPRIDRTWQALPRRAPIYGPIEGTAHHCTAGVSGPGGDSFDAYVAAFRDLDWEIVTDEPERFVMTRDQVRVTVRLQGAPDDMATIRVGVTG